MIHNVKITLNGIPNIEVNFDTETNNITFVSGEELITTIEEQRMLSKLISTLIQLNI